MGSQSVDVARWVRPAIEHAQYVLFLWVRPGLEYSFMFSLCRVPFNVQHFLSFYDSFSSFLFWLCPFLKNQIVCFGFVLRHFLLYSFVLRLESCLQKNNLSSFKLALIWFGYSGFSFLSHAIMTMRFVMLVSCVG